MPGLVAGQRHHKTVGQIVCKVCVCRNVFPYNMIGSSVHKNQTASPMTVQPSASCRLYFRLEMEVHSIRERTSGLLNDIMIVIMT